MKEERNEWADRPYRMQNGRRVCMGGGIEDAHLTPLHYFLLKVLNLAPIKDIYTYESLYL